MTKKSVIELIKSIIVATAIATAIFILMNMVTVCLGGPSGQKTVHHGSVRHSTGGAYWHKPSDTWRYNMGGIYWHKPSRTWHHDGGACPDTNYPGKERSYLQREDPEGVYERTKGHD